MITNTDLMKSISRRKFSNTITKGIAAIAVTSHIPVTLACASSDKKSLGIALVGLGSYSKGQLAPGLLKTKLCHLAGIVTGSPEKIPVWQKDYNIPDENIYNYDNFDTIINNPAIDIVYVVLPNAMHKEFCIRAAKAKKHVICEKPMAVSVSECDAIIEACKENGVKLSVGYRMQSEPSTDKLKELIKNKAYGKPTIIEASAGYMSRGNPDQWRLDKSLAGGGALLNMGVYAIQAAIYGAQELPIAVTAQEYSTRPAYFNDTDETITAQLSFPSGTIASIYTTHNGKGDRVYVACENGWIELDKAHSYGVIKGRTSDGIIINSGEQSQQALQMDDFAEHILKNTPNKAPGNMGKRDMMICEAIYKSISLGGKTVPIALS